MTRSGHTITRGIAALVRLVVLGTIVWAARSTFPPERSSAPDARAILGDRLARGGAIGSRAGGLGLEQYRRVREELDRV